METRKDKEKRIEEEVQRLLKVLEDVPEVKMQVVRPLVDNSAFMKVTLEDLQEEILESGIVEVYNHGGGQSGRKENSILKTYNRLIKNYESVTKTILANIPESTKEAHRDFFEEYILALEREISESYSE